MYNSIGLKRVNKEFLVYICDSTEILRLANMILFKKEMRKLTIPIVCYVEIEGSLVRDSTEALHFVLEQDNLISAKNWFNPGKQEMS